MSQSEFRDFLKYHLTLGHAYHHQKETMIWAALGLYLGGLGTLLATTKTESTTHDWVLIWASLGVAIITLTFLRYQYRNKSYIQKVNLACQRLLSKNPSPTADQLELTGLEEGDAFLWPKIIADEVLAAYGKRVQMPYHPDLIRYLSYAAVVAGFCLVVARFSTNF